MTSTELITAVLTYYDNVNATDSDNAVRRTRILQHLKEVVEEVGNSFDFRYKMLTSTISVTSGQAAMPADFAAIGLNGHLYYQSLDYKLVERPSEKVLTQLEGPSQVGIPSEFAVVPNSAATTASRPWGLILNCTFTGTLNIYYERIPPVPVDDSGSTDKLWIIPAQYHQSVLLPGVVAKTNTGKGDTRQWRAEFERGLAAMIKRENNLKASTQRLPRSIRGMW